MGNLDLVQLNGGIWIIWAVYWYIASKSANKTKTSEGLLLRMQHLVPLVLGLILIFRPSLLGLHSHLIGIGEAFRWCGEFATLIGLSFAIWGRVHLGKYWSGIITLKEGHKLIRTGPYRLVRHPLYTGFILGVVGSAMVASSGEAIVAVLILLSAYLIKIKREETLLLEQFGDEYMRFKAEIKTLIPFIY